MPDDRDRVAEIERIYRDRYVHLCRVATTVTGRVETAREAVQDGFALALAHQDEFRAEGSLEGWVGRIVLRAALDVRRRRAPDPAVLDDLGTGELLWSPELPHGDRDPALVEAVASNRRRKRSDVAKGAAHEHSALPLGHCSSTSPTGASRLFGNACGAS